MSGQPRYRGVFPVAPTTFAEDGELDLESQRRAIDFMIDAGSNGICILANFSEQFVLGDDERELLTATILEHVAGRVPVIVTTSHFSSRVCAERSRRAQAAGAAMVMIMPPYHGATILEHVAGRVPVIVTTSHFSSRVCAERSRRAQAAGAAMVMIMPPYHGATIRASEPAIYDFFRRVSDAIRS